MLTVVREHHLSDACRHTWRDGHVVSTFAGMTIMDPGGKKVLQACPRCGSSREVIRLRVGLWAWLQDKWYGRKP